MRNIDWEDLEYNIFNIIIVIAEIFGGLAITALFIVWIIQAVYMFTAMF